MRHLLSVSLLSLVASGALAEDFTLNSAVSAVTIYPQGATVVRSMTFDVPAGQHRLMISDIPYQFNAQTLQIFGGDGLVFGASQFINARVEADETQMSRRAALESQIEALEADITRHQQESAEAGLVINAANARIKLLESIGNQQAQGAVAALENQHVTVETLTALVSLVGSETLQALQDAQAARVSIAEINRQAEEVRKKLVEAREELAKLVAPAEWRYGLALDVEAGDAVSGQLQISYVIDEANWRPVYNFALDTGSDTLKVDRKVMITQRSGEDWQNAAVVVSTSTPFDWQSFALPYARLASIAPPAPPAPQVRMANDQLMGSIVMSAPEPVVMEESARMAGAAVNFQGITATYTLPAGSVISSNEETLVTLNSSEFDVNLSARANMREGNSRAFLIAEMVNTSEEPFLPGEASFFRDGAFASASEIGLVAAGATAELGFGKIDGLEVKRTTLRRETGESGVISTSNDQIEEYDLSVENVSNRAWDLVVYDSVPYSEQENLVIDWTARPRPTETDVEGRRGVMAWVFTLESGESQSIKLAYELEWPEGNVLLLQP